MSLKRTTGILLIFEGLILLLPLIILGGAINWPASLDEPARVNLPLILDQFAPVFVGYSIYLVYSLLFWPIGYLTGRVIVGDDLQNPLFKLANGFAAMSTIARALGIVRWLFAMPVLAMAYVNPATSPALKDAISVIYDMLNSYAGGVGELLGVSLFAVIWLCLINTIILKHASWPNWLAYFGFTAAFFLFLNLIEMLGVDMGPMITISVVLIQFWFIATGVVFLKNRA